MSCRTVSCYKPAVRRHRVQEDEGSDFTGLGADQGRTRVSRSHVNNVSVAHLQGVLVMHASIWSRSII